ncbi:3-deoxy-D-manno-octulosonic acid transferase [Chryseobacterium sp. A301]
MSILYPFFIRLLILGFKIGALFNAKLRLGLRGRKKSLEKVRSRISLEEPVLWMHAASLGEYEQGLPVLELLEKQYPHYKTLITFFSPSGYEVKERKNSNPNRVLCYLPFDLKGEMTPFVNSLNTQIFFTVKYDYWYELIKQLNARSTKLFVVSALFYKDQVFFKPIGRPLVERLEKGIHWFFHQTPQSLSLADSLGLTQGSVSGDTRFDRVKENVRQAVEIPYIPAFKGEHPLLIFGSSWEAEEEIAFEISQSHPEAKLLIAPHDLARLKKLRMRLPEALFYSEITSENSIKCRDARILVLDSIGMLSKVYGYGDLAVVGGGFHSKGLHNCLEAAAFGIPVFFGNQYRENPEADALIEAEAARSFSTVEEAQQFISKLLRNSAQLQAMGRNAGKFVGAQPSSATLILEKIEELVNNSQP